MKPTQTERTEFAAYCRGASASQLDEIERKERGAGRRVYAAIAKAEKDSRNA